MDQPSWQKWYSYWLRNHLEVAYGLPPPEFRKSGEHEKNPKIRVRKMVSGDPSAVRSITAHSITKD
jgi:hypothetical protein